MFKINRLYLLVLVTGLLVLGCVNDSKPRKKVFVAKADVLFEEEIAVDSKLFGLKNWVTDEVKFNNHPTIRLNTSHKYGLNVKLHNLMPDAFVRATVWRKSKKPAGNLSLTSKDISFYEYSNIVTERRDDGWEKLILEAFIPPTFSGEEVKMFVMNNSDVDAYFANLKVTVYDTKPYPAYANADHLELILDEKTINYINKKRKKSFQRGVITKKNKKEFDAIAVIDEIEYPISIRIKGDWLDHIQGNKWSLRIKMKKGSFKGMREFSIQQPGTRGYLNEWVLHKILENEDVLTTRYGFIPVVINGFSHGIYAYEEHFAKGLIESRKRREGPILKFNESAWWNVSQANLTEEKGHYTSAPAVESSIITPFKKKKTMRSETLRQQFLIGQNLLNQYRYDETPISDLLKVEQFAKFYAITNIGKVWHPTRWHNERFYYDPIASKLEIIAFDCYTHSSIEDKKAWLTPELVYRKGEFYYGDFLPYNPFNDPVLLNRYMEVLHGYLFTKKITDILAKYEGEIKKYEEWIQREFVYYHYNQNEIPNTIKELKPIYKKLKKQIAEKPPKATVKDREYNYGKKEPLDGFVLQGFTQSFGKIRVKNFHSKTMYLIGYSSKERPEQGVTNFEKPIEFGPYKNLANMAIKDIECLYTPDKIYFKEILDDTIVYDAKVMPWPEPGHDSPRQHLLKNAVHKSTDFAIVNDSSVVFKPGNYVFNKPVVIPQGLHVIIGKGTHLDFIEGAFFLSFSPVKINGNPNNKITIESSDGTGMGFTVIDAEERSEIEYVRFKGWNTLDYKGWILTGAVTFYESDVTIAHTEFLNNNCEDALNVIRSDFSLKHSLIANTFADGFDADFTTGIVYDCDFKQIGNDGIDYSGSVITIEKVRIDHAGDKGISGGESSTLTLKNIVVSNSNIGVASKDQSKLFIENIKLINCNCGFAAYQKKNEFGPAELTVNQCELKNVKEVYLLGKGSVIDLDGKKNKGKVKLDIDSLYAQ